jgi:hypothetical protein
MNVQSLTLSMPIDGPNWGQPGLLNTEVRSAPHVWSYRRILVTEGIRRSGLSLQSDDLKSVGELYTEDDFRQLVGHRGGASFSRRPRQV